ncbi:acyltransferase family protein [Pararhodobacter zhoushanensis]|uniref:acyltransferase family protein n=1 Tax=Pararhodobacter zhoushanensis TaxID=2479545 RepID=UPI000F8D2A54|nr:acyltransferase [Pararhodobacter zhoushanensis]
MQTEPLTAASAHAAYRARNRFGALDGLRFLAILGVLVLHSPLSDRLGEVSRLFTRGFLGVDLFFVISGYLITTLLLREQVREGRISLHGFYWRRALRILPLYLLVITTIGAYYVLVKQEPGASAAWPYYYVFLANFLTDHIPLLGPTWSLSVEEQYYLLWPLLLVLLTRRTLKCIVVGFAGLYTLAIMAGLGAGAWRPGPLAVELTAVPYTAILLGSGLALVIHGRRGFARLWALLGGRWTSLVLALLLLAELALLPVTLLGWPLLIVHVTMTAWLGSLVMREDGPLMPLLTLRPVVRIGVVSYGIYLLHLSADHIAGVAVRRVAGAPEDVLILYIPLYWGLAWLMAEISFRFYESRFLALRHKPLGQVAQR